MNMKEHGEVEKKADWVDKMVAWGCQLLHLTKYQKELTKMAKFVVSGVITTAIDWGIFFVLINILNFNPVVAQFFSFVVATIVGFYLNTIWVFDTTKEKTRQRLIIEFVVLNLCALAITEILVWWWIDQLKWNELLAKVVITAITMVFNYVTRKLTLEKRKNAPSQK